MFPSVQTHGEVKDVRAHLIICGAPRLCGRSPGDHLSLLLHSGGTVECMSQQVPAGRSEQPCITDAGTPVELHVSTCLLAKVGRADTAHAHPALACGKSHVLRTQWGCFVYFYLTLVFKLLCRKESLTVASTLKPHYNVTGYNEANEIPLEISIEKNVF